MDARLRADEALARARARGAFVVTPDNATSPMDAANTIRIPREVVSAAEPAETTQEFPSSGRQQFPPQQRQEPQHTGWPTEDWGGQELPPNPYHAQRAPNEFGPLGSQANPPYPQQ